MFFPIPGVLFAEGVSCKINCRKKGFHLRDSIGIMGVATSQEPREEYRKMEQEEFITKERKWEQITEKKRYQIEALLKANATKAEIARVLGYSRRTIEREIKGGLVEQQIYRENCKFNL